MTIQELSRDQKNLVSLTEDKQFRDQILADDLMITHKGVTILEPLQQPHLLTEWFTFEFQRRQVNDWNLVQVNILTMFLGVPVVLKFIWENWNPITQDEWVLSVTKEGFTLEFLQNLYVYGGEKNFNCNCTNYNFVKRGRGINKQKNVIEFVQLQEKLSTF